MRVLLIGFGPFPGAPLNPSALLGQITRPPAAAGLRRNRADVPRIHDHLRGRRSRPGKTQGNRGGHRPDVRPCRAPAPPLHRDAGAQRRLAPVSRRERLPSEARRDRAGRACGAARRSAVRPPARRGALRARFRRGCRAMPAAICATTPIGARWSRRALAGRWCSSFIFRAFSAVRAGGGLDADHPDSTPSLRLANASSLRSSRQAAVNRAGRIVTVPNRNAAVPRLDAPSAASREEPPMNTDRRRLLAALAGAAAGAAATPTHANEPSMPRELVPRGGIDAAALGIRPNSVEDQSKALQRAIEFGCGHARRPAPAAGLLPGRIVAAPALRGDLRHARSDAHRHVRGAIFAVGGRKRPYRHHRPCSRRRRRRASRAARPSCISPRAARCVSPSARS